MRLLLGVRPKQRTRQTASVLSFLVSDGCVRRHSRLTGCNPRPAAQGRPDSAAPRPPRRCGSASACPASPAVISGAVNSAAALPSSPLVLPGAGFETLCQNSQRAAARYGRLPGKFSSCQLSFLSGGLLFCLESSFETTMPVQVMTTTQRNIPIPKTQALP